ncbi:Aureobasidin resistance protein Aur1 [Xylographa opegraphella]|nr:Aureobasidin resistance protein Aur1 [Xylographa opegraphella]
MLAAGIFYIARSKFLPQRQADKFLRWDYDYIERGEKESSYTSLKDIDTTAANELSDWAVGPSSAISSGTASLTGDEQSVWDGDTLASNSDSELEVAAHRYKNSRYPMALVSP